MNLSFGRPAPTGQSAASDGAGSGRRKLLLVGGGGLAAVAVAGVAAVVLTQGGSATEVAAASPVRPRAATSTASPVLPTDGPTEAQIAPVSGADARDPFAPLVTETTAGTTAGTTASDPASAVAVATGSTATSSRTTAVAGPTSDPKSVSPTTSGPTPKWTWKSRRAAPNPAIRVTVKDVRADNTAATITVDAKKYTPQVGDVFAKRFTVLALNDGTCAAIRYGDQEPFDLCEGRTKKLAQS